MRDAESKLAVLETAWRQKPSAEKLAPIARDVIRLAEQARTLATERAEQARLSEERRAADRAIANAQSEPERAKAQAADYREALARSERALTEVRERVVQAQSEAERAKANEELARLQAERAKIESEQARQEAEQAKKQRDETIQQLYVSLSAILDTRREARGLIVNLSDVLFDFDKATLTPGAREKLSKIAGVLMAYPGNYTLEIEGHTDAVGSEEYNLKLSRERAEAVRDYLVKAGVKQERIAAVRDLGKSQPVASNDTAAGRQMNRRVELIINDTSVPAGNNY